MQAFLPLLTRGKGAILTSVSLASLAALPMVPAYSIKAAAFNMRQSLRVRLASRAVKAMERRFASFVPARAANVATNSSGHESVNRQRQ
jgi:hypothetical protein